VKRGHVTGTKVEKQGASAWYAEIERHNIEAAEDAERALVTALAHQVGNAVAAMPEAASRIRKAAAMVQAGDVYPLSSGSYLVGSQTDAQAAHLVTRGPWHCDCPDHTHRGVTLDGVQGRLCKHIFAVQLTIKVGQAYQANYSLPAAA
jgi:hypothetical protein